MEKLQCPKCHSDHYVNIQSRRRYFSQAALCLAIILSSYLIIKAPLLKPGEWNGYIITLIVACQTAFCIAIIMAIYYFTLGVFKRAPSYFCKFCKYAFDDSINVSHNTRTNE